MSSVNESCPFSTQDFFEQFRNEMREEFAASTRANEERFNKIEEQAKIDKLISSWQNANETNAKLSTAQAKIGGLNGGLAVTGIILSGIPILPIPFIGLGILGTSAVSGIGSHCILQNEKKQMTDDQRLGWALQLNPGKTIAEVTEARDSYLNYWQGVWDREDSSFEGYYNYQTNWNGINVIPYRPNYRTNDRYGFKHS